MAATISSSSARAALLLVAALGVALPLAPASPATAASPSRSPDPSPAAAVGCDPIAGPPTMARFRFVGDVALNTGSFLLTVTDIEGDGSLGSDLVRGYQSGDWRVTSLGPGWTHNYGVKLRTDTDKPRDVLLTLPSGAVERFTYDRGVMHGTNRRDRTLTEHPDGTWVAVDDATTWRFDRSGSLTSWEVRGRGRATLEYDAGGRLERVVGAEGPSIEFELDGEGRLQAATNLRRPEEVVRYEFDRGRLTRVARPDGRVERYTYDGDSERILTVDDGSGIVVAALEYDDQGRVVRQTDALGRIDGQAMMLEYERRADGWLRTTVSYPESLVDPGWHPTEVALHDDQHRVREIRHRPTSGPEFVGRYSYDRQNRRIVDQDPCAGWQPPVVQPARARLAPPAIPTAVFASVIWVLAMAVVLFVLRRADERERKAIAGAQPPPERDPDT